MRIAFSGSHRVGKTSLIERVAERLPGYATVDEPYALLEEEGYEFAAEPSVADFEAQLERSIAELDDAEQDVLFDRCPLDFLAYLLEHDDAAAFEPDDWAASVGRAMRAFHLIVFVPIEEPDRIALSRDEDTEQRRAVDAQLRSLLDESPDLDVVIVSGDLRARTEQVLVRLDRRAR